MQMYENGFPEQKFVPQPQDYAMDEFRRNFNFIHTDVWVDDEGNVMEYRCKLNRKLAEVMLPLAEYVIVKRNLPLEACIAEYTSNGILRGVALEIRYIPEN